MSDCLPTIFPNHHYLLHSNSQVYHRGEIPSQRNLTMLEGQAMGLLRDNLSNLYPPSDRVEGMMVDMEVVGITMGRRRSIGRSSHNYSQLRKHQEDTQVKEQAPEEGCV